jgi:hypothetical protein
MEVIDYESLQESGYTLTTLDGEDGGIGELMDLIEDIYSHAVGLSEHEVSDVINNLKDLKKKLSIE